MPITDEVEELLKVMGPFYELVDEKTRITQISDLSSGRLLARRLVPLLNFLPVFLSSIHNAVLIF